MSLPVKLLLQDGRGGRRRALEVIHTQHNSVRDNPPGGPQGDGKKRGERKKEQKVESEIS